jgi:MFS family permease
VLFAADAASNIVFAGVLLAIGGDGGSTSPERATEAHATTPRRGYREVLADRTLLGALFVNTLLVTIGTSQVTSAYPAWVTGPAHSTPRIVGFGFAANTLMLVAVQLFVLRQIRRRRRTDMAAGAGVIFAATWVVVLVGGHAGGGRIAGVLLVGALAIFALGESLLSPSLPALVNELSPEALRGRYNAVFTLSWQVGPIVGPALAGFLLGRGLGNALFLLLAGSCLAASACAVRLRSAVPGRADFAQLET